MKTKPPKSKPAKLLRKNGRPAMAGLITLEQARHVFGVNRATVDDWVRKGLPVKRTSGDKIWVDPNTVRSWTVANSLGGKTRRMEEAANSPGGQDTQPIQKPTGEKLDTTLKRADKMELRAWQEYVNAVNGGQQPDVQRARMRLYVDALTALRDERKSWLKRETIRSEVWEEIKPTVEQWIDRVKSALEAMPVSLAQRVNPLDPATAEGILKQWRDGQFYPVLKM